MYRTVIPIALKPFQPTYNIDPSDLKPFAQMWIVQQIRNHEKLN